MFDEEEYGSDSSDEDYMPQAGGGEGISDEDSGEEEDLDGLIKDAEDSTSKIKGKRKKNPKKKEDANISRKRKGGIRLEDETESAGANAEKEDEEHRKQLQGAIKEEQEEKKALEEKKKADDLWTSFMSDIPTHPKRKPVASSGLGALSTVIKTSSKSPASNTAQEKQSPVQTEARPKSNKIAITKEYDFAGETVRVTTEVDADSKEAKAEQKRKEQAEEAATSKPGPGISIPGLKRPSGGGLGSVLGKIGKKPKMGTLEKSRLDWNDFKQDEGIGEELSIHNRGKEGYIERQAFLNRTDHRQFEQERNLRMTSKR